MADSKPLGYREATATEAAYFSELLDQTEEKESQAAKDLEQELLRARAVLQARIDSAP